MKKGFTLVELLVVVAILAAVVAIIGGAIQKHRESKPSGRIVPSEERQQP